MIKRKLILTGFIGFAFLFGCNQIDDGVVEAGLPNGFEVVTKDKGVAGYQTLYTIKNVTTGCFYAMSERYESVTLTQMFIEKDGVTVPYCEKRGE